MVLARKWVEVEDHPAEADQQPLEVDIPIISVSISFKDAWGEEINVQHEIPVQTIGGQL